MFTTTSCAPVDAGRSRIAACTSAEQRVGDPPHLLEAPLGPAPPARRRDDSGSHGRRAAARPRSAAASGGERKPATSVPGARLPGDQRPGVEMTGACRRPARRADGIAGAGRVLRRSRSARWRRDRRAAGGRRRPVAARRLKRRARQRPPRVAHDRPLQRDRVSSCPTACARAPVSISYSTSPRRVDVGRVRRPARRGSAPGSRTPASSRRCVGARRAPAPPASSSFAMPKSSSFTWPPSRDEDVARLQVAMDDEVAGARSAPRRTPRGTAAAARRADSACVVAVAVDRHARRRTPSRNTGRPSVGRAAVEQPRDVRMLERGEDLALVAGSDAGTRATHAAQVATFRATRLANGPSSRPASKTHAHSAAAQFADDAGTGPKRAVLRAADSSGTGNRAAAPITSATCSSAASRRERAGPGPSSRNCMIVAALAVEQRPACRSAAGEVGDLLEEAPRCGSSGRRSSGSGRRHEETVSGASVDRS